MGSRSRALFIPNFSIGRPQKHLLGLKLRSYYYCIIIIIIIIIIIKFGARFGLVVSFTPRPFYFRVQSLVPTQYEAARTPEPICDTSEIIKVPTLCLQPNHDCSVVRPVPNSIPTELSRPHNLIRAERPVSGEACSSLLLQLKCSH